MQTKTWIASHLFILRSFSWKCMFVCFCESKTWINSNNTVVYIQFINWYFKQNKKPKKMRLWWRGRVKKKRNRSLCHNVNMTAVSRCVVTDIKHHGRNTHAITPILIRFALCASHFQFIQWHLCIHRKLFTQRLV